MKSNAARLTQASNFVSFLPGKRVIGLYDASGMTEAEREREANRDPVERLLNSGWDDDDEDY